MFHLRTYSASLPDFPISFPFWLCSIWSQLSSFLQEDHFDCGWCLKEVILDSWPVSALNIYINHSATQLTRYPDTSPPPLTTWACQYIRDVETIIGKVILDSWLGSYERMWLSSGLVQSCLNRQPSVKYWTSTLTMPICFRSLTPKDWLGTTRGISSKVCWTGRSHQHHRS